MMYDAYPITFRSALERESSPIFKLDKQGVLMYKIPYTQKFDYYPVSIAQYALGNYEMFLKTGKKEFERNFLINAKWLHKNMKRGNDFGIWEHRFVLPYGYNFKIPWVHGMGQALALSTLMRAYFLTNDDKFLKTINLGLGVFDKEIENMGVKYVENGNVWYEEYGVIPPTHILNGFMYILISLFDVYNGLKIERAKVLATNGIKTLKQNLPKYDLGYWSLYDLLHRYPATKDYHQLHILQLNILAKVTGRDIFREYANIWESYQNKSTNMLIAKLRRGITHINRLGVVGVLKRYREIKNYFS